MKKTKLRQKTIKKAEPLSVNDQGINKVKNDETNKIEDIYKILDLVNYWIGNIDSKNSIGLAFVAVIMAGICYKTDGIIPVSDWIQPFLQDKLSLMSIFRFAFSIILYISCCISAICFLSSIWGRISCPSNKKSHFFFGTIASISIKDYKHEFYKLNKYEIIDDLLEQICINSTICSHKVKLYNWGLTFLIIAVIIFFACFFLGFL